VVPGTAGLADLFTGDLTHLQSPTSGRLLAGGNQTDVGCRKRGTCEVFALDTDILAVDGSTAVVQVEVRYRHPLRQQYRDL
jgi:hypothetical protein